jgi:MOSC domain-containing protein YiiM
MEVISVNVGRVGTVRARGRDIRTAIFKEPVEGPVAVRQLGLEGDHQADRRYHGGMEQAVYAYAIEDVRFWEQELGREFGPGFFGENLTLSGVEASGAPAGQRWRVGSALLEVTTPRTPCLKLAARVGEPGFQKRFQQARRPGTYLRVLEEGEVSAGDAVTVLPGS